MSLQDDLGIHSTNLPTISIARGRKKPGGGVVDKDRFWLVNSRAIGSGTQAYKELAPEFAAYNDDPEDPKRKAEVHPARRVLHATIMHVRWEAAERGDLDGAVYSRFQAQPLAPAFAERVANAKPPPGQAPWCTGNGRLARRWTGAAWIQVPCPGDRCEFRKEGTGPRGMGKFCGKMSSLVLQLRWPMAPCPGCKGRGVTGRDAAPCAVCRGLGKWSWGLPTARAMMETGGTYSYATDWLWGFSDLIVGQWKALGGIGDPDLYGLPVRLTLQYKSGTNASGPWAAWLPQMEPDFEEVGGTLQGWLAAKAHAISGARGLLDAGVPARYFPTPGAKEATEAVYEPIERPAKETP